MGNLVFQATLGGQVSLSGPNTASTYTLNVPAVTGTLVTTGDTGTVTNTMLAASAYNSPGAIGSSSPSTGAFTSITDSGLTSGRITYAGTSGLLQDSANLTFNGTTLTAATGANFATTSGNVGIGTSSPSYKLDVNGDSLLIYTGARSIVGNADKTNYSITDVGAQLVSNWYNGYVWKTAGGAERMRMNSSGQVLIGQTSANYSEQLAVTNPTTLGWAAVLTSTTPTTSLGMIVNGTASNLFAAYFQTGYVAGSGGNLAGLISCVGSTTSYGTTSDHRLKENVEPMVAALDKVNALRPVTYNWIADGKHSQGFIAHELQAIVPECVVGEKDAVDENGKPKYQVVDTSFLIATLTAAIQELNAKVEALQAKVG